MSEIEFETRLKRVREEMERNSVDFLVVGPSTDLFYLTGFSVTPSERLTILIVPRSDTARLVMPDFELPTAPHLPALFEPLPWSDGDDAATKAVDLCLRKGNMKIAFGDQLHARFLLDLIRSGLQGEFIRGDDIMRPLRITKSVSEIAALRTASAAADNVAQRLGTLSIEGSTEREVARMIQDMLAEEGNQVDVFGSGLASFGENTASPHHHPSDRAAQPGDAGIVDFGGARLSYRADITRMLHVGPISDEYQRIHDVVDRANEAAFARVAPGVPAGEVDAAARDVIAAAGYGDYFLHRTGHGVGLDVHEPPYIVSGNEDELREGMTFTIEPGIYLTGKFGVRIEDVVLVTANGAERLNTSTHEVTIVS